MATKTFILLLAQNQPLSFLSGQPIKVDKVLAKPNRTEYHHCFPKAKLKTLSGDEVNMLANFAVISSADNKKISAKMPSEYRKLMPQDASKIMDRAAIPESLFEDNYQRFVHERAELLVGWLNEVTA